MSVYYSEENARAHEGIANKMISSAEDVKMANSRLKNVIDANSKLIGTKTKSALNIIEAAKKNSDAAKKVSDETAKIIKGIAKEIRTVVNASGGAKGGAPTKP